MHNSTSANAVESPNTTAPIAIDTINPNRLRTAPRSFPQTPRTRPTHLKINTRNTIANKIDIFYHGNTILFCSEFNKPDLERGYLIAFNKCRMINIYHKIMVNITNIIPDVNENENRKLKYLFLVGAMEK